MKNLFIKSSYNLPEVKINSEKGTVNIKGRAHPENIDALLNPLSEWLEKYELSPAPETSVTVKLDYFNSIASKVFIYFFSKISAIEKTKMKIIWHYYDLDTLETLKDFKSLLKVEFKFVREEL